MKKIIKRFCLFLGKIFKLIDKIIITPVMKVFIRISNFFSQNNKTFERIFANKQALIVISLILAFLVFWIVDNNSNALVDSSAEILYSQPLNAIYNEEAYVIEGLPETVDVILIGRRSDIYLAKQLSGSDEISVDLRELSVGTHRVNLKYRQGVSSVEYKLDPSTVTVIVYDKVSATREVTAEVLHRNNLDSKLDISNIKLSKTEVTIKGSAKKLEEVAYVKALIDIDNLVDPTVGETTITGNKLLAYNNNGEIVDVEILPETVDATLTLTSTSKVVPIRVVPVGDIALGYAIESTTTSISNITIYGDEDSLRNIEYVPVKIDISNLSAYKEFNVNLEKPSGVRDMSEKTVTVKVNIGAEAQKEVTGVHIQTINLANGLKASAGSAADSEITVLVKGSKKLLDDLDTTKITATVDLSEYTTPGEYEVEVKVSGEDLRLSYASKTKKIKIKISE